MSRKDINNLNSEQLFELARQREQQEQEKEKEALKAKVAELRAERKRTIARHKRELAQIDAQIREAGGRARAGAARKSGQAGISSAVLDVLSGAKKADTKTIRAKLEAAGVNTANLGQTLAYLKRTGRIKSLARGTYAKA